MKAWSIAGRGAAALLLSTMTAAGCEPEDRVEDDGLAGEDEGASSGAGSDDGMAPDDPGPGAIVGDVILRNRVALDMPVLLRPLGDQTQLDCDAVEADPGANLPTTAFADGEVHTLAPHQMIPVWSHEAGERECYAVWVETEGLGVRLLYWRDGEPPILPYPDSCCEVGQGVVELIPVNDGWSLELLGNTWLVHDPSAT